MTSASITRDGPGKKTVELPNGETWHVLADLHGRGWLARDGHQWGPYPSPEAATRTLLITYERGEVIEHSGTSGA